MSVRPRSSKIIFVIAVFIVAVITIAAIWNDDQFKLKAVVLTVLVMSALAAGTKSKDK